jgi:serine/threonine protein kinase
MLTDNLNNDLLLDKEFPILDDKYILIKKIGSGATCKVKLGKSRESEELVAIKILNNIGGKLNTTNKHHLQEIEMLKKINHPNIINLKEGNKGIIKKPDGRTKMVDYIVLEYAGNAELFDYIYFPKKGLSEKMARAVFKMLIEGLEGCHLAGVTHRDLKTENIMLNFEWVLKIADFGYATLLAGKTGNGMLTSFLGTLSYAAPEILNKKPYVGSCADIFSCGVILFVLATAKLPFGKAVVFDSYYKNIIRNDYETFWKMLNVDYLSDEIKSLINLLLAFDPSQRPTIIEIKNHSWMKGEVPSYDDYKNEFENRKLVVLKGREMEAEQEAKKKKKGGNGGVYRGDNDHFNEDEEIAFDGERIVEDLVEGNDVFNPYKLKLIGKNYISHLNFLVNYFKNEDKKQKEIVPHKNLAKFKVIFENEKFNFEDAEGVDEEIIENLKNLEVEKLSFEVNLKKVDDENYVAEFTKLGGDKYEFFNIYDQFINFIQTK